MIYVLNKVMLVIAAKESPRQNVLHPPTPSPFAYVTRILIELNRALFSHTPSGVHTGNLVGH